MSFRAFSRVAGFTLVELLVSLAVIALLTVVLLSRYPDTTVRLTLANMTYTTSLLVREAQVRGSAIDSVNSTLGGYGVYVALNAPNQIVLFGDTIDGSVPKPNGIAIGNGLYESGSPVNELKTLTTFPARYTVSKLCVGTSFPFTCNSANNPIISSLTISFTRPDPSPSIYINNAAGTPQSAACIELRSPSAPNPGHIRSVQVYSSGMIRTVIGKCDNS